MPVSLEIEDGNPSWYLSHDIWTVPGNDPEGPPGPPVAGTDCYLWARVHNKGTTPVSNATVRFYWANPAVGFDRNTANFVGSSFVTLDAGESAEVLCLTPWVPQFVNGGHECLLAEAFHPAADPLPPGAAFDVPTDRHVAQLNLSVILALKSRFHLPFEIHNPGRRDAVFTLTTRTGEAHELERLKHIPVPKESGGFEMLGFVAMPCPEEGDWEAASPVIERLQVPAGGRVGLTLIGRLKGSAALVHVLQSMDGHIVGGLGALVLSAPPAAALKKGA